MLSEYLCKRTFQSSAIQIIGYNEANQTLLVILLTGQAVEYSLVAPFIFQNLLQSDSIGASYHAGIKGKFPGHKWDEGKTKGFLQILEKAEREQLVKVSI